MNRFPATLPTALGACEIGIVSPESTRPYWIFFEDKALSDPASIQAAVDEAARNLSEQALRRRAKVRGFGLVDMLDVPVARDYVRRVLEAGCMHRTTSRWLNAVSVDATEEQIATIRSLSFVAEVRSVAQSRPFVGEILPAAGRAKAGFRYSLNYGECLSQLEPIQVPLLHDQGLSGAGVIICMLDTGFLRTHDCLVGVNVIAERDFINDDAVTSNEPGDPDGQHNHGTYTLSLIAGFDPGNLIGPAYGAAYALAKTEDISDETPVEEDYWVEGIEWADSLGAQLASSSLSYRGWYTYEDMDGNTAVTTVAGDLAVQNGMVVVVSAGNQGSSEWHYISAPADGDSVLAIGAVDSLGVLADWSSRGPTYDGRLKPDVVAMGAGTLVAIPDEPQEYGRGSGTSFSCPITAGACALLLESHPDWTPGEVAEALKMTALNADEPDSNYGWGLIQISDANDFLTGIADNVREEEPSGANLLCHPNPCWGSTTLSFSTPATSRRISQLEIYDVRGRKVRTLVNSRLVSAEYSIEWDGRDESGQSVAAGVYYARFTAAGVRLRTPIVVLR
jgi:hypothetical protein